MAKLTSNNEEEITSNSVTHIVTANEMYLFIVPISERKTFYPFGQLVSEKPSCSCSDKASSYSAYTWYE